MGQLRDDSWILRRAIEYLTGGLMGLRRDDGGRLEVAVVRPRTGPPGVDPGWDVGAIGGHDLAVLHAIAEDGPADPWESDVVDVAGPPPDDPFDPRHDLGPARGSDPEEFAFF
jgi:hypothetical protein